MRTIPREQAIEALRTELLKLTDDEHSACDVATRRGILCRGFAQWSTGELRKRHGWIVAGRPAVRRAELEDLANRWQLARERTSGVALCCDLQARGGEAHPTCGGWNDFADADLARFHHELLGEEIRIAPATVPPRPAEPRPRA